MLRIEPLAPAPARRPARTANRLAGALAALWLTLAAPAALTANGESPCDTGELLATWQQAAGGEAWESAAALRTTGTLRAAGLSGTFETLEDLATGRSVTRYDLGVAKGVQGFDGERAWEVTPAGELLVKTAQADLEAAVTEAWLTARAHWFTSRRGATVTCERNFRDGGATWHVLRAQPEGGREVELWLDAATGLLARRVESGSTRTTTTSYDDWRTLPNGLRVPFRAVSTSGDAASETRLEVASVEVVAAPEASAFAPPEVAVDDFAIAGGATSATVPFELLNNHVYVMARVNGSAPRRFLVDTGGVNLLTRAAADALGVTAEGAMSVGGVGTQREQAGFARLDSFTVGGVTFEKPLFIVLPFAGLQEAEGVPFDGLIGYEAFQRFVVTIDYARRELTLTRPEVFQPPAAATAVPFEFNERHPVVKGAIDGIPGTFTIDTGSRSSLDLHGPFVAAHDLGAKYPPRVETITGWGLGGPARSRVSRAARLELGGVPVADLLVELTSQESGAFTDRYLAGNVGTGVLKRFTLAFDYSRQTLWMAPNGLPADAFDRAGVWLNAEGPTETGATAFRVEAVVADGPAAVAGLTAGDRIVAVDGTPATNLRLPDLRERLRSEPAGTVVRFTLAGEAGASREVAVTLRDLF
jgi:hypothetical protein